MSFKAQAAAELAQVFFNAEEFAEAHDLNGTVCPAVLEGLTTEQRSARAAENFEGMCKSARVVHVRAADLPETPLHGEIFRVDGKIYLIDTVDSDMGMLTIELAANEI